jgi:CRP-like cAMP-binding protein
MRKLVEIEKLRQIPLFAGLSEKAFSEMVSLLHCKDFPSEAIVITAEQPGEVIYIILQGSVRVVVEGSDRDVILAIHGPGEVIGEMSVLDGLNRSASVITQENSTLLWLGQTTFWEQLWKMEPVPLNMARILAQRVRLCTEQIQALAALDVNGRVARQLLAFAREHGQAVKNGTLIPMRITQTELADMVGASRVRVNQILVYWKQHRYIAVDANHHITVLNKNALMRYLQ